MLGAFAAHLRIPLYGHMAMVPQTVPKIAICDCPRASGDCLVRLITKLAKAGGVYLVGNGRLLLVKLYYAGTRLNPQSLPIHLSAQMPALLVCVHVC